MFENNFKNMQRLALVWGFISVTISLSVLAFLAWVIIKLMSHFGVI